MSYLDSGSTAYGCMQPATAARRPTLRVQLCFQQRRPAWSDVLAVAALRGRVASSVGKELRTDL